ncbi:8706_t:CDS:1, partial [Funneliformis geosporum]
HTIDDKFISRDTLRKRKTRENETPSQRETRLAKQHEYMQSKRVRKNDNDEGEVRAAHDKE